MNYKVLILNFILLALSYSPLTIYSTTINEISKQYQVSNSMASLGISLLMLGYAMGSYVESKAVNYFGFKKVITAAIFMAIIPQFIIPMLDNFYILMILRFIQGCGIVWYATTSMATAISTPKCTGVTAGIVSAAIPFGIGLGGLIAGYSLELFDSWKTVWNVFGLLLLIYTIFWFICINEPKKTEINIQKNIPNNGSQNKKPIIYYLAAWISAFALFFNAWQLIGLNTIAPNYLSSLGYSSVNIGNAVLFGGLIGAISTPFGGILSDVLINKFKIKPISARAYTMGIAGFFIAAIGSIFFPFLSGISVSFSFFAYILAGFGIPLTNASISALPRDLNIPEYLQEELFGFTILVGIGLGATIIPFITSMIAENISFTFAFTFLCLGAFFGFILSIIIPFLIKE